MRLLLLALLAACFFFFRWLDQTDSPSAELLGAMAVAEGTPDRALDELERDPVSVIMDEIAIVSRPPECSLSVSLVCGAKGLPIAAAKVVLEAWEGMPLAADRIQVSSSDGRCRFDHLRPGTYDYRIEQAGKSEPWTGHWKIEPGALHQERLDLSQPSNVH